MGSTDCPGHCTAERWAREQEQGIKLNWTELRETSSCCTRGVRWGLTEGLTDVLLRCICMKHQGRKRKIVCSCRFMALTAADTHKHRCKQTFLAHATNKKRGVGIVGRKINAAKDLTDIPTDGTRLSGVRPILTGQGRSSSEDRIRTAMVKGSRGSERVPSWKNNGNYWNIPSINWCHLWIQRNPEKVVLSTNLLPYWNICWIDKSEFSFCL